MQKCGRVREMVRNQTPRVVTDKQEGHPRHNGVRGSSSTLGILSPEVLHWKE